MKGDAKVIEYLNRGLRSELTAINQYWLHYRMLDNWGYKDARQAVAQGIDRGDAPRGQIRRPHHFPRRLPNMQVLDPLRIGQNVKEMLDCDLAAEHDARNLYQEARDLLPLGARTIRQRDPFEELMKDEERHIDFLETQLDLVKKLGLELYAQHHIGEFDRTTTNRSLQSLQRKPRLWNLFKLTEITADFVDAGAPSYRTSELRSAPVLRLVLALDSLRSDHMSRPCPSPQRVAAPRSSRPCR